MLKHTYIFLGNKKDLELPVFKLRCIYIINVTENCLLSANSSLKLFLRKSKLFDFSYKNEIREFFYNKNSEMLQKIYYGEPFIFS